MGLVDYSDSDASGDEAALTSRPAVTSSKPAFQKVVDRSNPGKIRVSLPQASLKDDTRSDEPPAKRAKIGGGAFSGFNSFLPAPKRTGPTNATLGGGNAAKKGLGSGVSLKTGAAPGFSREAEPEGTHGEEQDTGETSTSGGSGMSLPPPKSSQGDGQKPVDEVKLIGKPLMFRPLSVSGRPAKKKKQSYGTATSSQSAAPVIAQPKIVEKPAPTPKVPLFSMSAGSENYAPVSTGEYKPMMYEPEQKVEVEDGQDSFGLEPSYEDYTPTTTRTAPPAVPTPPVSQSLNDIAGDLNLSAAERRQLFGRQKGGKLQATKVINFNTDQEYLHNEEIRASGEQVSHNPVRAIAAGKHSLKQLVNAAQSQKEALEESFAKGRNNRAEASSRYGW